MPKKSWFFRYKLYHLPFWFAYHCMLWTLTIGSLQTVLANIFFSPLSAKFFVGVVFHAAGVYFNLYSLIPRLLERGRYVAYVACLLLTIGCMSVLLVSGYYASAALSEKTFHEIFGRGPSEFLFFLTAYTLPSSVASTTLGMSVKLAKKWLEAKRRERLLEREKLETELKFLRSQFNPHFLFNTINSIFVLIRKNPDLASEALAKFSDLLRYQLYECNEHQIPLRQELGYLRNFIELQRLRLSSDGPELFLAVDDGHDAGLTVAPFVLIPFVENAFKHVSHSTGRGWIRIRVETHNDRLHLCVANSVSAKPGSVALLPSGGVGLANVQRRLNLTYPDGHRLSVGHTETEYRVDLLLYLRNAHPLEAKHSGNRPAPNSALPKMSPNPAL